VEENIGKEKVGVIADFFIAPQSGLEPETL
jgi:hypothetical protein